MRKLSVVLLPVLGAAFLLALEQPKIAPMPGAVSSNAVASLKNGLEVYSLMGIGPKKNWDDVTNQVYVFHLASNKWSDGRPVPGVAGRLGASAVGAKGHVFLFGGYVIDGQGTELTVPDVNAYIPENRRWYRAADIPVPVDNAVIGLNHDRYIYLIGGHSKSGPVNNVQVYDIEKDAWTQATAFPGTPVYGHAGGLADDTIVFVDGAKKNPTAGGPDVASDECWMGKIDHKDPDKIEWSKLPTHPGTARFAIIAGAGERDHRFLFSGGTAKPHDFKGFDSDGKLAEVSTVTFAFDLHGNRWESLTQETFDERTDSRGILFTPIGPMIIGGLVKNGAVTARAVIVPKK
jgi:N-acetylneuraminic acid mutarotase